MSNDLSYYDIECYRDIIGLSRIDCECYDENLNWDESYSGLYIDEAEGLSLRMVDAQKDCENDNNLWLLMDTARGNAIRQFIADTHNRLLQRHVQARTAFKGVIGRHDYKNTRTISKTYAGQRWFTANVVGGYAHITEINTFFSAAGNITLSIYNNLNELISTHALVVANGKRVNAVDIRLPLWNKNITNLEYIFLYTYDPLNKPKDNEVGCSSCGITYSFNCRQPYFRSGSNKLSGWAKWLMVGNHETNTLSFMDMDCSAGNYTNGLSFTVSLYCDLGKQFCFDDPDIYDPSFMSVAFALRHMAAYFLIVDLLASPNVSRYTMVGAETLAGLMTMHKQKYDELIEWLVKNADIRNTDCIKCRDHIRIGVQSL